MKKLLVLISILILAGGYLAAQTQTDSVKNRKMMKEIKFKGEKLFFKHAEKCLEVMEKTASEKSVKGVAFVAFIPGNVTESWISRMKVVGKLINNKDNFLAVAGSKASEMATTFLNSGSGKRALVKGELGFKGGIIMKVQYGYILASFSGGPPDTDAEISQSGIQYLSEFYK